MSVFEQHFTPPPRRILKAFGEAFEAGNGTRLRGGPIETTPYGFPINSFGETWTQADILIDSNARRVGWLLGWLYRDELFYNEDPLAHHQELLQGALDMAVVLWWGVQLITSDNATDSAPALTVVETPEQQGGGDGNPSA